MKEISLYIHIPFCVRKCFYCDFYSIAYDKYLAEKYVEALKKELTLRDDMAPVKSIYIGGGTPTILETALIADLISFVYKQFTIGRGAEISVETNPGVLSQETLKDLRLAGINRISLGVQSFIDRELKTLGRIHDSHTALHSIEIIKKVFNNFSIDLIYGIPSQSVDEWIFNVEKTVSCEPKHISAYELTLESGTPLERELKEGNLQLPDEDEIIEMVEYTLCALSQYKCQRYEISNYALPGYECKHNLSYWKRGEYVGIGASAHSFTGSKRFFNVTSVTQYIELTEKKILPVRDVTMLTVEEEWEEYVFLGLRLSEGIELHKNCPINEEKVNDFCREGFAELNAGVLKLTDEGMILSNSIIGEILM